MVLPKPLFFLALVGLSLTNSICLGFFIITYVEFVRTGFAPLLLNEIKTDFWDVGVETLKHCVIKRPGFETEAKSAPLLETSQNIKC